MTTAATVHPIFFESIDPAIVRSPGRFNLTKPWWRDGCLWSSDGSVLIRCEMPAEVLTELQGQVNAAQFTESMKLVDAASTYGPAAKAGPREHLLIPGGIEPFVVTETDETKAVDDGWERRHIVTTKRDINSAVLWDGGGESQIKFRRFYLGLLLKHGVTHLSILYGRDGYTSPALFRGDGFDGLLMPVVESYFDEKKDVRGVEEGL